MASSDAVLNRVWMTSGSDASPLLLLLLLLLWTPRSDLTFQHRVVSHRGEHQPFLVVVLAEDFVLAQVELVPDAESMIALLTSEALQMIHIVPGPHHHLEGWYHFVASGAEARVAKQPQIIPLAQHQIALGVQCGSNLPEATIATTTFQTILVPQQIQCPQQKPILNVFPTAGTQLLVVIVTMWPIAVADSILTAAGYGPRLLRTISAGNTASTTTTGRRFRLGDVHRHHG